MPLDNVVDFDIKVFDGTHVSDSHAPSARGLARIVNELGVVVSEAVDLLNLVDPSETIADPGNAGAIPVTNSGYCALVTTGAQTRTLAIPSFAGQRLLLALDTDGGNAVVTVAAAINAAGNTIMTFDDAGDTAELIAVTVGSALRWRIAANVGVGLS